VIAPGEDLTIRMPITAGRQSFGLLLLLGSIVVLTLLPMHQPSAKEAVTLKLKWQHQFQFAGFYAAKQKGYYQDEGLEVEIRERKTSEGDVDAVLEGKAQFVVSDSSIVLRRLKGEPFVVLAPIFQHSPLVLLTLQKSGIIGPMALRGKRIMMQGPTHDAVLAALLDEAGLSKEEYTTVPYSFKPDALLTQDIDAQAAYITNEPFLYRQRGIAINIIRPSNYGIDFYGDMLVTTEQYLKNNTSTALAFRRASLKGWQYAMDHPEEVIDWLINQYNVDKSRAHLRYEARMTRQLIQPEIAEIGHLHRERVSHIADVYQRLGLAPSDAEVDGLIYEEHLDPSVLNIKWLYVLGIILLVLVLTAASLALINKRLKVLVRMRTAELEESRQQLEQLSTTDFLTGLANRRRMDAFFQHELERAERYDTSLSVILLDMDRFKAINDQHGHRAGDQVLEKRRSRTG